MNARLNAMRERVRARAHANLRQASAPDAIAACEERRLSWPRRAALLTRLQCEAERPTILDDERIAFTRTVPSVPAYCRKEDWEALFAGRKKHELGPISNICADWGMALSQGLLGRRRTAQETRQRLAADAEAVEFLECAIETIDAVLDLARRYAAEARRLGKGDLAEMLEHAPANPPRGFHEALQSLLLLRAAVWLSGHYHVGLGRFDQYMWPYLEADLQSGRLDLAAAEELLAEFFICLNKDSDLYPGVQQGDNGQSLMLGGVKRDGSCAVNELTRMALRAARDVSMIDPKINLRITAKTDVELLSLATELTRKGLGFPQYSNDDVTIPALVAHGYDLEDARDYTVAACWEFIIPGKGMEVVNIGAVSFPAAADRAIRQGLARGQSFEGILANMAADVRDQTNAVADAYANLLLPPAPYYSALMDGCLERGRDLSKGLKYNNFGIHGACAANAADALAAVKQFVFDEKSVRPAELLAALEANFDGHEALRLKLRNKGPKIGGDDERADSMLAALFDALADACEARGDNGRGGLLRPGTGTAMYYVWLAAGHPGMSEPVVGATADGRRRGEFFSANLAPSPGAKVAGLPSVFRSFARIDYRRICNGGPITIEIGDSVFAQPDAIWKVATMVKAFARLGCQQMQINSLNGQDLLEAKAHPERHAGLIVRVWGWSGYFCELSPEYQDHVIARCLHNAVDCEE